MRLQKRIFCGVAIIIVAALTVAGVSGTYALLPFGILAVSIVGCVVSASVGLIFDRYSVARAFGWLSVLAVISLVVTGIITALQERATGHAAASVATALETYRVSHGDYPTSLDQLVPDHFSSVPKTRLGLRGTSYFYSPDTNGFRLGYALPFGMWQSYDSKTREWTTRD